VFVRKEEVYAIVLLLFCNFFFVKWW